MSQSLVSTPPVLANGGELPHSSPRVSTSAHSASVPATSPAVSPLPPVHVNGAAPPPQKAIASLPPPPHNASKPAKLVVTPSPSAPAVSSDQAHAHVHGNGNQTHQLPSNGLTSYNRALNNTGPASSTSSSSSSSPSSSAQAIKPSSQQASLPSQTFQRGTQPSHWYRKPTHAHAKDIEDEALDIECPPSLPLAIVFQHHERPGQMPAQTTLIQRDDLTLRISDFCHEAGYREWSRLMEVAPLASQHHMSRYNQLKFGANGSPFTYVPMTLQSPAQSQAATDRQRDNERRALDWLVEKRSRARQAAARARQEQQELARAKSRQLHGDHDHEVPNNLSVESGSMAKETTAVSGGIKRRSSHAIVRVSDLDGDAHMRGTSPDPTSSAASASRTNGAEIAKIKGPINATDTMAAEWETPIGGESSLSQEQRQPSNVQVITEQRPTTVAAMAPPQQQALAVKTSDTHPIHISPIIPPEHLASISTKVLHGLPACVKTHFANSLAVPKDAAEDAGGSIFDLNFDDSRPLPSESSTGSMATRAAMTADPSRVHADGQIQGKRLIRCRTANVNLREVAEQVTEGDWTCQDAYKSASNCLSTPDQDDKDDTSSSSPPSIPPTMGNLLLSSCPGKKVRLTGPVRGRGAICRDLGLDLQRFRQMGIGAIVCCLDDEELAFLGAPWESYEREADALGLDVIRLPMAEGFAPTSVETADAAITSLVSDYTLQGVHVLVHCRGGVGRAGLIACIWMLKLGLVWEAPRQAPFFMPKHLYKVTPRGQYLRWESRGNNEQSHSFASEGSRGNGINGYGNGRSNGELPFVCDGMTPPDTAEITRQMEDFTWRNSRAAEVMGCHETLCALVDTIRMRRSLKAIETAEQVHFLARYIEYLCLQEQHLLQQGGASERQV